MKNAIYDPIAQPISGQFQMLPPFDTQGHYY